MGKNKTEIRDWKEFTVSDLFKLVNSTSYHKKDIIEASNENKIAYITRSKFNNGLSMYVTKREGLKINPKNTISFGAENANFFFQDEEYITGNKMYYIDTQKLNPYAILFIKTIFEKTFSYNYSFSDGLIPDRIKDKNIKLPIDIKGNPDWNFMEQHMRIIEEKVKRSLKKLNNFSNQNKKIDTTNWGEFLIENLFEIKRPIARSQSNYEIGSIPFVASGNYNNGVLKHLKRKDNETLDKGNCITVSPVDGSSFYQGKDFLGRGGAGSSIVLLYNEHLNNKNGIFIATIVRKICSKYLYNNMGSKEIIAKEKIMLPITLDGQPNYEYMDKYINSIMNNAKGKVNYLNKI